MADIAALQEENLELKQQVKSNQNTLSRENNFRATGANFLPKA